MRARSTRGTSSSTAEIPQIRMTRTRQSRVRPRGSASSPILSARRHVQRLWREPLGRRSDPPDATARSRTRGDRLRARVHVDVARIHAAEARVHADIQLPGPGTTIYYAEEAAESPFVPGDLSGPAGGHRDRSAPLRLRVRRASTCRRHHRREDWWDRPGGNWPCVRWTTSPTELAFICRLEES